jgi:hypothetical protein
MLKRFYSTVILALFCTTLFSAFLLTDINERPNDITDLTPDPAIEHTQIAKPLLPASNGLPEIIAGLEVIAVESPQQFPCGVNPETLRVVLKEPVNADPTVDYSLPVIQELERLQYPVHMNWQVSIIPRFSSRDQYIAFRIPLLLLPTPEVCIQGSAIIGTPDLVIP